MACAARYRGMGDDVIRETAMKRALLPTIQMNRLLHAFRDSGVRAPLLLAAAALAAGLTTPAAPARAQGARSPALAQASRSAATPELSQRLTALEREQMELKAELTALRERLDALLGPSADSRPVKLSPGNAPVRGNPDAAITLILFGDYQSVYSVRAHYVVKRLLEDYPTALRVVYKQYPLPPTVHPQATDAALAALAAERQGKFWELNELLYQNSRRLDAGVYPVLADQAGLNLAQFEKDRHGPEVQARLSEDEQSAAGAAVPGVPALYLNNRLLPQWRYDYVRAQIEALRKK
jgi:protein-disulfide isomerase